MPRRVWGRLLLLGVLATPLFARQEPTYAEEALLGFDPVILIEESREVLGRESISVVRGGFWYLFANDANKAKFEADPKRYEIQNGGVCARMGGTVAGHADNYLVHDGRIYIFGSANCRELFAAHPEKYLEPRTTPGATTPAQRRQAARLIGKAVGFLGGTSRIDSLRTLHLTGSAAMGGEEAKVEVWRVFPDRWKRLVQHSRYGEFGRLMTDAGAYRLGSAGARRLTPGLGENLRAELLRDPLEILRARTRPDFQAAVTADNPSRIVTWVGDIESTLTVDAETGEIREISYLGRGGEGEVGTVVKRFSDYREINGLRRPFRVEATFEGTPLTEESLAVASWEVDADLSESLFSVAGERGDN